MRALLVTIVLALAVASGRAAASSDPAFGFWLVENRQAIIELYPCRGQACGRIVWLERPYNDDGTPKTDINNPDPEMREMTLCGLQLISGLERDTDGAWEDGQIYNSRDGSSYSLEVTSKGDLLVVYGYLGISLLGRSQTWARVDDDRGGCPRLDRPGSTR